MNKAQVEQKFRNDLQPICKAFAERLHTLLVELVSKAGIDVAQIEHRTKSVESFLHKLQTKKYADPFQDIKDVVGLRIITYYPDDVSSIADLLKDEFVIDQEHSLDKFAQLNVDEFGYRSIHLVVRLKKPRTSLPDSSNALSRNNCRRNSGGACAAVL